MAIGERQRQRQIIVDEVISGILRDYLIAGCSIDCAHLPKRSCESHSLPRPERGRRRGDGVGLVACETKGHETRYRGTPRYRCIHTSSVPCGAPA